MKSVLAVLVACLVHGLHGWLFQLLKSEWKPNYGPADFVPSWGATLVGARKFLIAYNVNLLSTKEQAHRIALDIREQGRGPNQVREYSAASASSIAPLAESTL